jgi:AcrR family transcriptional regulator
MSASVVARRSGRVRPGPVSAAEAVERRELIIKVAGEEFLDKGFEGATLAAIASRCRISRTTLYELFESKEALFMHVSAANVTNFTYDIQKALDLQRPFEAVIKDVVELMVETSSKGPGGAMLRLVIAERDRFPTLGRLTHERGLEIMQPLAAYLKAVSGKDGLTTEEASHFAYHLTSMAVGGFGFLLVKPSLVYQDTSAWIKSVTQLFIAGFPAAGTAASRRSKSR